MTTRTISHCECGRRKAKYVNYCQACSLQRHREATEKAQAIVRTGKCPNCGEALRRNLSIAGWWQCSQLGAVGFRKDAAKPSCSFQCFTE